MSPTPTWLQRLRAHGALVLLGLFWFSLMIGVRVVRSGWAPFQTHSTDHVTYGIASNTEDSLSYLSWATQSQLGHLGLANLYTLDEHRAAAVNPLLWLAGVLARMLQVHPILVLNVAALLGTVVALLALGRLLCRLYVAADTRFVALLLALTGGGASWLWYLFDVARGAGGRSAVTYAPDLYFYDLFPWPCGLTFPYHTLSFALLTVVLGLIVKLETAAAPRVRSHVLLGLVLTLLAWSRPYEPVVLAACYAGWLAWSWFRRNERAAWVVRFRIALVIAAAVGPATLYSLWLARQPVWQEFAQASLHLAPARVWPVAILIPLLLVLVGGRSALRALPARGGGVLLVWSVWAVVVPLIAPTMLKLMGGSVLALGLVAASGYAVLTARFPWSRLLLLPALLGACLGSPLLIMYHFFRECPVITAEERGLLEQLAAQPAPDAAVLAPYDLATLIPGLTGQRVYCGHWSLSNRFREKYNALQRVGLQHQRANHVTSADEAAETQRLQQLLEQRTFTAIIAPAGWAERQGAWIAGYALAPPGPHWQLLLRHPDTSK